MKEIKLTRGKIALIDDGDFERVNQFKWYACLRRNSWYAIRSIHISSTPRKGTTFSMHRFIINPPSNMEIDHIDGDGLNNQKSNLRICTGSQNHANTSRYCCNSSGYKGIQFIKNKYMAGISKNKRYYRLGRFSSSVQAALAYDKAARELFGEFARTNFPDYSDWT